MQSIEENVVPNLLRHIFPSYRVPRLNFAEGMLPARVPPSAWCVDSTLGLGRPALNPLSTEQVVTYYEMVNRINAKSGLIRQTELLVGGETERAALQTIMPCFEAGKVQVEPVALINAHPAYVEPLADLGLRTVGIRFGVSDYLVLDGRSSREGPLQQLLQTVDACLDLGCAVRLDLVDLTRADLDGFVLPLLERCIVHLGTKRGAKLRVRFCDSLGLGVPWPETHVPRSIPRAIHTVSHALEVPSSLMEFVGYDDLGLAVANTLTALEHGCSGLVGSFAGLGIRAGIAPVELLLVHLSGHYGVENPIHLVPEMFDLLRSMGADIRANHPLWGERALLTSLPPLANAAVAPLEVGLPFDTRRILGREGRLELRVSAGAAGLTHLISANVLRPPPHDDPGVQKILSWLEAQHLDRYTWETIAEQVSQHMPYLLEDQEEDVMALLQKEVAGLARAAETPEDDDLSQEQGADRDAVQAAEEVTEEEPAEEPAP